MIVLNIESLDQVVGNKKQDVWYTTRTFGPLPQTTEMKAVVVDGQSIAYNFIPSVFSGNSVSESSFLLRFPDAIKVTSMTTEAGIGN